MTRPAKRPTRALPAIYVVVDRDGFVWCSSANRQKNGIYEAWAMRRPSGSWGTPNKGDRIVKYAPVPATPRRRSR